MVSKWERNSKFPEPIYRRLLCQLYGVTEQDLGFRPAMGESVALPLDPTPRDQRVNTPVDLESPLDIAERSLQHTFSNTSDDVLAQLDDLIGLVVAEYETAGPKALAHRVVRHRQHVEQLLTGRQAPRQRDRLYRAGAKLSGLLGYMAVNLGRFSTARAYCAEAFQLADLVADADVMAWTRGTESFCSYYEGDYARAVDLARDGQRLAGDGPQAVRLAINGEARALAKLGDERGVNTAVDLAHRVSGRLQLPPDLTSCISFEAYGTARTAANAATAYLSLRRPERVREFADQVMPVLEASRSCWSQSLVRLDIATALVVADKPEPDEAARLVTEALMISAERPITSVLQRSREFLMAAAPWRSLPDVIEATETLRAAERR
jgi:hypothetical protein